jgi:hypothetical protein
MTQTATAIETKVIESAVAYTQARRAMDHIRRGAGEGENTALFDAVLGADDKLRRAVDVYLRKQRREAARPAGGTQA